MLDSEMEGDLLKDAAVGGVETDPTGVHTSLKLVDIGQRRSLRVEQVGGNERGIASSQDREVDHIFGGLSMRPVSRQKDESVTQANVRGREVKKATTHQMTGSIYTRGIIVMVLFLFPHTGHKAAVIIETERPCHRGSSWSPRSFAPSPPFANVRGRELWIVRRSPARKIYKKSHHMSSYVHVRVLRKCHLQHYNAVFTHSGYPRCRRGGVQGLAVAGERPKT